MFLPSPFQRRPETGKGVLLVFIGVLLTPIVPPVGLVLSFAGLLLPWYQWRVQTRMVPVPVRVSPSPPRSIPHI